MRDHAKLKVLILEDRAEDAELALHELRQAGYDPEWQRVETEPDYLAQLDQGWGIILADYNLPLFSGLRALELWQERGHDIPFILVSGTIGEDQAVAALKAGASDYVIKDRLGRLGSAVERALGEAATRREHKQAVEQARLAHGVLDLLNRSEVAEDTVREILQAIKQSTGFDAVGIRLRQGDDFPYYTTHGFAEDFVRAENALAVRSPAGQVCRDQDGKPILAGTCGLVLSGQTDPGNPRFTPGGSFWTNESLPLLDLPPAQDPRLSPRNRCIHDGYHSMALIPLRSGREIIGLLQLNDHRPNRLTLAMIQFLEGLGASIGIAVARQQAAKTLSENEARYRTLVESIPQKIFLKDRDSRFVTVNENFARELGIRPEEVAGKTDYDFFPKEFADKYRADDTRVMATGKTEELEERVGVAGPEIWVHTIKTPVHNDQGEVTGVFGIYWDITERKQLEESLLRSQRMEGIGSLAGGIAHDLNNILTPILLIAPFLRAEADASERNILVDTVESSAQRGADIIKQLLTFARGKPGARIIVPVRLLLQEMGQVIRETFPRNIQFHLTPPADLWPAFGDPTQFHQAILNLCVNARDAMPGGGTLTLGASNVHVDQGFVATLLEARPGAYLCVSVADTGTGIPPEHLHRIFDPFFTTKEVGKGTGLGLSTLLGIMRGHEGFIRVDTKPGRGTTFELYFPALPEAKEIAAPKPDAPPPHGQGELILVVDDEPDVIRIVELGLKKRGYRVVAAREGREALAVFASHRAEIKAVLTDMMMPGMDGPELVRALRQMNAQMPILGMTGLGELADTAKLEDLNLAEVLHKPFSASHMLATLHHALAQPM